MDILRVSFLSFNTDKNHYAKCIILIRENIFNISTIYNFSVSKGYYICSDVSIDKLINQLCEKESGDFLKAFLLAKHEGMSFTVFPDFGNLNMNMCRIPRFTENDFENVIKLLGGNKIPETINKTPDFVVENILLELKDLQKESLENKERQKSIARVFENVKSYSVNIDPSVNYGKLTCEYHRIIKNTLKNHFKSASEQIKQHKKTQNFKKSGIVIFNTGFSSLPHKLFKEMVIDILNRETKTIEFAFIFSQKTQTNGWNMNSVFVSEWIGIVPNEIKKIKSKFDEIVNMKMSEMIIKNNAPKIIESQKPISFEINNKIFYWNPEQIKFPWEEK